MGLILYNLYKRLGGVLLNGLNIRAHIALCFSSCFAFSFKHVSIRFVIFSRITSVISLLSFNA